MIDGAKDIWILESALDRQIKQAARKAA